jgi:protein-tyrosine phosphatase
MDQVNRKAWPDNINIIFVCTGNTCRSSMAEGLFKAAVKELPDSIRFFPASRGIHAYDGDPASEHSIKALRDLWNIDISLHRAKMLNDADVAMSDLILTMTRQHRDTLRRRYPGKRESIFTLKEFVYPELNPDSIRADVGDPYGMPYDVYEGCARELQECIKLLVNKLSFF